VDFKEMMKALAKVKPENEKTCEEKGNNE